MLDLEIVALEMIPTKGRVWCGASEVVSRGQSLVGATVLLLHTQ